MTKDSQDNQDNQENEELEVRPFGLDYDFDPTPQNLKELYDSGFKGVKENPTHYARYRGQVDRFYDAFPEAKGAGIGIISSPFKAALVLDPGFGSTESQTSNDCVSMSTRNAGMIDYCVDALFGETEFKGRLCTENLYGARGDAYDRGANCSELAEYVSQQGDGGFLYRGIYKSPDGKSTVDLSKYKASIGVNWGRSGPPKWINDIASQNKALRVFSIKSVEEARDALAAGFGISLCSDYGFSSERNSDGVSESRGSWNHGMAWVGVDDSSEMSSKYGGPLFLIQNSWGIFNDGPKRNEQPDGSFYIRPKIAKGMIAAGGAWCLASVRGYNRELVYDTINKIRELSND